MPRVPAKMCRVLIAEDYADARLMLKMALERKGVAVLEASDGQQAVEIATAELPDLILMDLSMPVMNGFEATRVLKAQTLTQHILIIAVSAHCSDPEQRRRAHEAGCAQCMDKPIDFQEIDAALALV